MDVGAVAPIYPSYQPVESSMHSQPSRAVPVPPSVNAAQNDADSATSRKPAEPTQANAPQSDAGDAQRQAQAEREVEQVISQLKMRDQEVRTHEQAHLTAAGPYARGGISYEYQTGPDGRQYAIGGSVSIDTSPIAGDPEATLQKASVVQRAALAPADPSPQDFKVAAQASQMMMQAQAEIREEVLEEDESRPQASLDSDLDFSPELIDSEAGATMVASSDTQADNDSVAAAASSGYMERDWFDMRVMLQQAG